MTKYYCPFCNTDVSSEESSICPSCGKVFWQDELGVLTKDSVIDTLEKQIAELQVSLIKTQVELEEALHKVSRRNLQIADLKKSKELWSVQDYNSMNFELFSSKTRAVEYIKAHYPSFKIQHNGFVNPKDNDNDVLCFIRKEIVNQ